MKHSTSMAALSALAGSAAAFQYNSALTFSVMQFNGQEIRKAREDPIVSPGVTASHVHQVMGGSAFSKSSTGADLLKSECTNSKVLGDNSNYWFPGMYFEDPVTKELESVPISYVNVYYHMDKTSDTIKAFPAGLSMLVGDPTRRTAPEGGYTANLDPSVGPVGNVRWTCPRSTYEPPSWPADSDGTKAGIGSGNNGVGFPFRDCDAYASPLRGDIHFPSCYKPDVGLTDYKNNMAYPTADGNGNLNCAKGEIHVPRMLLEVYFETSSIVEGRGFQDRWDHSSGTGQPFVLAQGDRTGFGWHGDFMAGWDEDVLQNIIDNCDVRHEGTHTCPGIQLNTENCPKKTDGGEDVDGPFNKLPGNNPLTGYGDKVESPAPSASSAPSSSSVASSSSSASSVAASSAVPVSSSSSSSSSSAASLQDTLGQPTNVVQNDAKPVTSSAALETSSAVQQQVNNAGNVDVVTETVWHTVTVTAGQNAENSEAAHVRRHLHGHRANRRM